MMGVGGIQQPASQQSPDYPLALSKIQVMSKQELDDLLNDDEKFDDYIRSLQQIMQLYSEKEELMTSNKSLASITLVKNQMFAQNARLLQKNIEKR